MTFVKNIHLQFFKLMLFLSRCSDIIKTYILKFEECIVIFFKNTWSNSKKIIDISLTFPICFIVFSQPLLEERESNPMQNKLRTRYFSPS